MRPTASFSPRRLCWRAATCSAWRRTSTASCWWSRPDGPDARRPRAPARSWIRPRPPCSAWRSSRAKPCGAMTMCVPKPRLSLVIPAYNEERRLPASLAAARRLSPATLDREVEVLVVENGSIDGTARDCRGVPAAHALPAPVTRRRRRERAGPYGRACWRPPATTLCSATWTSPCRSRSSASLRPYSTPGRRS